ncbi:MAG: hypothetical protein ACLPY1_05470 [Terracidiphilus sp.]
MQLTTRCQRLQINLPLFLAALACVPVAPAFETQSSDVPAKIADQPLTAEQLAVYRTMLVSWYQGEKAKINLRVLTDPVTAVGDSLDKRCLKGLSMEPLAAGVAHRIRKEDLARLGPFEFRLIEPKAGANEVSDNDPGKAIQKGEAVDAAVENGFAHGLLTVGEIQFDKTHTHALVSFSFVCGRLCGNGTTMLLEKTGGIWRKKAQCGGWVS